MQIKKIWNQILNILIFLAIVAVIGLGIAFIYNTFVVWLIPSFKEISIIQAIGASLLMTIAHMLVNFWVGKVLQVKALKSLEAIQIVNSLSNELTMIKSVLKEKDIL